MFEGKLMLIGSNCKAYNSEDEELCSKAAAFQHAAATVCEQKWQDVLRNVYEPAL